MGTRAQVDIGLEAAAAPRNLVTFQSDMKLNQRNAYVLTAEDNDDLRDVMQAVLELNGFHVTACPDAEEAERVFSAQPDFDLLLTDLEMPGQSGAELAANLSGRNPSLPVMIVSGANLTREQLKDFTERGWAFLSKPFSLSQLVDQINLLLATQGSVHH